MSARDKWNGIYSKSLKTAAEVEPAWVLQEHQHLLPDSGNALDLASGLGGNAWLLANAGLETQAWDISDVAMNSLQQQAMRAGLPLKAETRDVVAQPPEADSLDVIVVAHYLQRSFFEALKAALRLQGLLFYQTFTQTRSEGFSGPSNPDFLLQDNELLSVFSDWKILVYREDGLAGNLTRGRRGIASAVVQKLA